MSRTVFGRHYVFWNSVGLVICVALLVGAGIARSWGAVAVFGFVTLVQTLVVVAVVRYKRMRSRSR
jgi:hypothetical protein